MFNMKNAIKQQHVITDKNRRQETKLISEQLKLSKTQMLSIKKQQNSPLTALRLLHDHITAANERSN